LAIWPSSRNASKSRLTLEHSRRALEIFESKVPPGHPHLIEPLLNVGARLRTNGKQRDALALAERALGIAQKSDGDPSVLAEAQFAVAQGLVALDTDEARALALAREALAIFNDVGDHARDQQAKVERWLAEHD
jgi:hypothetical protein